jgi:hypothetical protein
MLESEIEYSWAELKDRLEDLKHRQAAQPNRDRAPIDRETPVRRR